MRMTRLTSFLNYLTRFLFSCEIPASVVIGSNIVFAHYGLGVTIHGRTTIGDNVKIYQNVTIGSRNGEGPPRIGDNVLIGAGACILGDITIGNNVQIGANAVVLHNIPDNSIAVGVPAKVISNNAENS
ncbi:serine acetyltransferase [Fusibacter paucivorans]|uniref:Serine acetyltransferase n=2 Tax=Fusibacter paucivorans TaxID=76009 RepID=A0ABS5PT96_9FIRM|nr:serine acetyltransferase [Fusibacter paucivorans]